MTIKNDYKIEIPIANTKTGYEVEITLHDHF